MGVFDMEKHENVMLLSMSRLPVNKSINTYKGINKDGQEYYFKGISQLEAHSKYVAKILDAKSEKIDRFVILSTKETRTNYGDSYESSAVEFYKMRMSAYLTNSENSNDFEGEDNNKDKEEIGLENVTYENTENLFKVIELEDPIFFWKAANAITGSSDKVRLFMDMQGGDRNIVARMNAIVQLLGERVEIGGRFANNYDPQKSEVRQISDVSSEYKTYELITAMDSFKRYGRGDGLVEYFKDKKKEDEKAKALTEAIKNASDAIQFCDVDGFDKAINEIAALHEKFVSGSDTEKTEMDVIYEDIYRDYKPLINAEHRYVEQIRWCIKKKFFQQALTIFEAKMPNEYVVSGLKYYCNSKDKIKDVMEKFENIYFKFYPLQKKTDENGNKYKTTNKEAYRMKYLNHFFICDYEKKLRDYKEKYKEDESKLKELKEIEIHFGIEGCERVEESIKEYNKIKNMRNKINHVASVHNKDGFFYHMFNNHKKDKNWKLSNQQIGNVIGQIEDFLEKFCKLAAEVKDIKSIDLE